MAEHETSASDRFAHRFDPLKLPSGVAHPYLLYGTAFKEDRAGGLTVLALKHGFEGLDSANYPTAYEEAQAGDAIQEALKFGVKREDLFVQTKFTPAWCHAEGKLSYNANQPLEGQVRESIEQSFTNLKVDYIDALFLHVPFDDEQDNLIAWSVMESFVPGRVGALGVSNCPLPVLEMIYNAATVKPQIVQNRFQKQSGYDIELRDFLEQKGGIYQAFYLLKTNEEVLSSNLIARFSREFAVPKEVAFYLLVLGLGNMSIVNGTTSEEHMMMDVEKVTELLGDQHSVQGMRGYLGEFEELLSKVANEKD